MAVDGLEIQQADAGEESQTVALESEGRYLVHPGSVGQPRDGDPRAAYAIVDTDTRTLELVRLKYLVDDARRKIVSAGLPGVLARRLGVGR